MFRKKNLSGCKLAPAKKVEPTKGELWIGAIHVYEINGTRYVFSEIKNDWYLFKYGCSVADGHKTKVLMNSDNLDFLIKAALIKFGADKKEYDEADMQWLQKSYKVKGR